MARGGYSSYGHRGGKSSYKFTANRQRALRRAQFISAQKRKRNAKRKKIAKIAGVGVLAAGVVGAAAYAGNRSGSSEVGQSNALKRVVSDIHDVFAPAQKEKMRTRVGEATKRKQNKRRRKDAAVRRQPTNRKILEPVSAAERKRLQSEAEKNQGPSVLDSDSYNPDGTTGTYSSASNVVGAHIPDAELRRALAQQNRARARNGGQAMSSREANEFFKRMKAGMPAVEAVKPQTLTGKKTRDKLPKIVPGRQSNTYSGDPLGWLAKARMADDALLDQYSHKITTVQRTKGVPGHRTERP